MYYDDAQKAFEDGCGRKDGFIRGFFDLWLWVDLVKVVWHGVGSVVWDRVWGGEGRASRLINASVMYINTGQLRDGGSNGDGGAKGENMATVYYRFM